MSEQRQRVEAEARELYPDGQADEAVRINELRAAFIAGRTVTDEQVEKAAWEFALQTKVPYGRMPSHHRYYWRQITVEAFRAAGLLIEGEDHE